MVNFGRAVTIILRRIVSKKNRSLSTSATSSNVKWWCKCWLGLVLGDGSASVGFVLFLGDGSATGCGRVFGAIRSLRGDVEVGGCLSNSRSLTSDVRGTRLRADNDGDACSWIGDFGSIRSLGSDTYWRLLHLF